MTSKRWHLALLGTFLLILLRSAIHSRSYFIWILEVFPAIIGAIVLIAIYPKIKLTMLLYCLIWLHALVLILGGHWTYAEMPLFNWLRDEFALARNYYDRLGHVMQGFVPAIIAREVFLRNKIVNRVSELTGCEEIFTHAAYRGGRSRKCQLMNSLIPLTLFDLHPAYFVIRRQIIRLGCNCLYDLCS